MGAAGGRGFRGYSKMRGGRGRRLPWQPIGMGWASGTMVRLSSQSTPSASLTSPSHLLIGLVVNTNMSSRMKTVDVGGEAMELGGETCAVAYYDGELRAERLLPCNNVNGTQKPCIYVCTDHMQIYAYMCTGTAQGAIMTEWLQLPSTAPRRESLLWKIVTWDSATNEHVDADEACMASDLSTLQTKPGLARSFPSRPHPHPAPPSHTPISHPHPTSSRPFSPQGGARRRARRRVRRRVRRGATLILIPLLELRLLLLW